MTQAAEKQRQLMRSGSTASLSRSPSVASLKQLAVPDDATPPELEAPPSPSPQCARCSRSASLHREALEAAEADAAAEAERLSDTAALDWKLDQRAAMEELVGTSIVLAFLQVAALMPVVEVARLRAAAAAYFDDLTTPAGWSFTETCTAFLTLLSPGVLNTSEHWWLRSRLWKAILCQSREGWWEPTSSLAFVLEARSVAEVASVKETWLERLKDRLGELGEMADDLNSDGLIDVLAGRGTSQTFAKTTGANDESPSSGRTAGRRDSMRGLGALPAAINDDPLACTAEDVVAAMPRRLATLRSDGVQVDRVWATLCCCAFLETINCCWLHGDGDIYAREELTIVDTGRRWIDAHAAEHPGLADALADGLLAKAASRTVAKWHRAWERRIGELRCANAIRDHISLSQAHRCGTEVLRAACTKHTTMRIFLSAPLDGLQRWQLWTILLTMILNQLLVNIWMFYARGGSFAYCHGCLLARADLHAYSASIVNCCAEVSALLGCAPGEPCRGREGVLCGDLADVFADEPVPPYFPDGLKDYTCRQFPDDDNPRDSLIVALIALAVALPVTAFIASCFAIANDNEAPESWLSWAGLPKLFYGPGAHRRWYYTGPAGQPVRFGACAVPYSAPPARADSAFAVRWWIRCRDAPWPETFGNLLRSFVAWVTCSKPPWIIEAEEDAIEAELGDDACAKHPHDADGGSSLDAHSVRDSLASARHLRSRKRQLTVVGLVGVYLVWAIFAW